MNGMRGSIILTLVILLSTGLQAQKNYTAEADNAYKSESFFTAVDLYKKAYTKEKKKSEKIRIIFRIGECYRLIENPELAEEWYLKAEKAQYGNEDPLLFLNLADVMRVQGQYTEAKKRYQEFANLMPDDKRGKLGVSACELSEKWLEKPNPYIIMNISQLNSKQYDYGPVATGRRADEIIFVSSRPGTIGSELDSRSGEAFSDLFTAEMDRKGKWSVPKPLPQPINTEYNEGPATVTKREGEMYYTHCPMENNQSKGCEIWMAVKKGQDWAEPRKLSFFPDSVTVGHPSISKDDLTLFFASDAPGGKGGKDIWFVTMDKKSKEWSEPKNVAGINTPGDELFPFIHDNGSLYFSSNGHPGMGGLDIYKAEQIGKDEWGNPENVKPPINSSANDYSIFFMGESEKGYFTSNREGGKGGDDIYSFKMPPVIYTMSGTVKDVDCKSPISGATVKLIGTDGSSVEAVTDAQGAYKFDEKENGDRFIESNTSYTIVVSKTSSIRNIAVDCESKDYSKRGYLNGKGQETTVGIEKSTAFIHDFELQCSNCGEIKFKTVLYELAKWDLMVTPEVNSKDSLNDLYQTLIDNPNIVIELSAHTDARGSEESNQELSQKRAQSCVEYLISKGIEADRLVPKGYGEGHPLVVSANGVTTTYNEAFINSLKTKQEQEAAHQLNRRTVFSVLRDDYVPQPKAPEGQPEKESEGGTEGGAEDGGN